MQERSVLCHKAINIKEVWINSIAKELLKDLEISPARRRYNDFAALFLGRCRVASSWIGRGRGKSGSRRRGVMNLRRKVKLSLNTVLVHVSRERERERRVQESTVSFASPFSIWRIYNEGSVACVGERESEREKGSRTHLIAKRVIERRSAGERRLDARGA